MHPEEDAVEADEQGHRQREREHQSSYGATAHEHPGEHDRHARGTGDPGGVAGGEGVAVEHLHGVVPRRAVASDQLA